MYCSSEKKIKTWKYSLTNKKLRSHFTKKKTIFMFFF